MFMTFIPKEESWLEKIGDYLMLPLMYLLQVNIFESPQRTHFWNNTKYTSEHVRLLDSRFFVSVAGVARSVRRWLWYLPLFHMPIVGGWREYVVLAPAVPQDQWYVGWIAGDALGISHIKLKDQVRLLRGDGPVQFFGLNEHGEQIVLHLIGEGIIGKRSEFSSVPLL